MVWDGISSASRGMRNALVIAFVGNRVSLPYHPRGTFSMLTSKYRFVDPAQAHGIIRILTIPPERMVQLLGEPEERICLLLHWVGPVSRPCLQEDCPYCPLPTFAYGYAPVACITGWADGMPVYRRAILPLTETVLHLATLHDNETVFSIKRVRGEKNSPMQCRAIGKNPIPETESFDIFPHLERIWAVPVELLKRKNASNP